MWKNICIYLKIYINLHCISHNYILKIYNCDFMFLLHQKLGICHSNVLAIVDKQKCNLIILYILAILINNILHLPLFD